MNKKIIPCVIGLGYVGLPVFLRLQAKYSSIGFDNDKKRINNLIKKIDTNKEFNKKNLILKNKSFFTSDKKILKQSNFFIVTVPTPITKNYKPDLSHLKNSSILIAKNLKKNDVIVYESTVYPGTTNLLIKNYLNKYSKLREGFDYFVCYSPERINPGDDKHSITKIKKILAIPGHRKIKDKVKSVYRQVSNKLILTHSIESAETAKVIENIQRDLNIAFINDILLFADKMNYNFDEILKLASSKWNFLKFNPGLVGGHCLPVDPHYLNYVANLNKIKLKTLLAGRHVNNYMQKFVLNKIEEKIKKIYLKKKKIPRVLICGLTYKKNVSDIRNSLSLKILINLRKKYKNILGYDYVCEKEILSKFKINHDIEEIKDKIDLAVFLVDHKKNKSIYNYFKKQKKIIIDPFKLYK